MLKKILIVIQILSVFQNIFAGELSSKVKESLAVILENSSKAEEYKNSFLNNIFYFSDYMVLSVYIMAENLIIMHSQKLI